MIHISDILKDVSTTNLSLYMNNNPVVDYVKTSNSDIKFFTGQESDNDTVSLEELLSYIELENMEATMVPGKNYIVENNKLTFL